MQPLLELSKVFAPRTARTIYAQALHNTWKNIYIMWTLYNFVTRASFFYYLFKSQYETRHYYFLTRNRKYAQVFCKFLVKIQERYLQ